MFSKRSMTFPYLCHQPSMEHGSTVSRQGIPGPRTLENSVNGAECLTSSPSQVCRTEDAGLVPHSATPAPECSLRQWLTKQEKLFQHSQVIPLFCLWACLRYTGTKWTWDR